MIEHQPPVPPSAPQATSAWATNGLRYRSASAGRCAARVVASRLFASVARKKTQTNVRPDRGDEDPDEGQAGRGAAAADERREERSPARRRRWPSTKSMR